MFISLLLVTFVIAIVTSGIVAYLFKKPVGQILDRIVAEDIGTAWERYLMFAIAVVGISGGVRVWQLERYIIPAGDNAEPLVLNAERWTLEVYQTIIGTLQSIAWMLLVFFIFALIAYVIVRGQERRRE